MAQPHTPDILFDAITELVGQPKNFFLIAKLLHQLHSASLPKFNEFVASKAISRRRAYQLTRIADVFGPMGMKDVDLESVGFTKLNLLAEHKIEKGAIEISLDFARNHTVKGLRDLLKSPSDSTKKRVVLLYLTEADYASYRAAMLAHGAKKHGKGLIQQEGALMKLITQVGSG